MIIYTQHITNRLIYVLDLIFNRMLNLPYTVVNDLQRLDPGDTGVINYSSDTIENAFTVCPYGLLSETGAREHTVHIGYLSSGIPVFFSNEKGDLPFDIFSAVFYLVSRYEEYLPFEADKHERFPARCSVAWKHDFLDIPVVNYWVKNLAEKLVSFFPGIKINLPGFYYLPTIDVDQAWAVKHKPLLRIAGGFLKDLLKADFKKCSLRLKILRGKVEDPFYTFPGWDEMNGSYAGKLKVFVLAGKTSSYDMIVSSGNKAWQKLVKDIASKYQCGFHPSYNSDIKISQMMKEKKLLEKVTGRQVVISRQHFLKLQFPGTYRNLIQAGIHEDYSMAYPEYAGFRAGIAFPFPFYDLEKETSTDLIIYPFAVMDRTCKDYMGLTPSMAIEKIDKLIARIKDTGGLFISAWHNDSLSDYDEWKGWKEVYLKMTDLCKE